MCVTINIHTEPTKIKVKCEKIFCKRVVMEEGKGRVCVTGGTGFLGSWIIKRLLEDGYIVNATVRDDPGL